MFRILSIDGGGVRGYLAAGILANIESYLNAVTKQEVPLGLRFDFIAGTSAGGLIALGLARGRTALEVRNLFSSFVPKVFGADNRRSKLQHIKYPLYGSEPLEQALREFFGTDKLKDLVRDACVTSVSLVDAKPMLHKTDYLARNEKRLNESLVDVAMATTAAPTYLAAHSSEFSANLVDGGLAANNPSVIAYVDALQFERPSKRGNAAPMSDKDLMLVSVGTGQPGPLPYKYENLTEGGWLDWVGAIHEVVLLSQSQLVHHQAKFLVKERYLRVDPVLNTPVKLDDAEHFEDLRNKVDIDIQIEQFLKEYMGEG
jgi:patatin-like phospholipase/acyl hydrolase